MNNIGESLERKPKSFGINRFLPQSRIKRVPSKFGVAGYKGMSFVPGTSFSFVPDSYGLVKILSEIPYADIIKIGGTIRFIVVQNS